MSTCALRLLKIWRACCKLAKRGDFPECSTIWTACIGDGKTVRRREPVSTPARRKNQRSWSKPLPTTKVGCATLTLGCWAATMLPAFLIERISSRIVRKGKFRQSHIASTKTSTRWATISRMKSTRHGRHWSRPFPIRNCKRKRYGKCAFTQIWQYSNFLCQWLAAAQESARKDVE